MIVDVVLLPSMLRPEDLRDRSVAVFDVLRATTTMAAALAAGVAEIRVFPDIDSARSAAEAFLGSSTPVSERTREDPDGIVNDTEESGSSRSTAQTRRPSSDNATSLLAGEVNCLRPEGFDLGNSPGDLDADRHAGRTLFMCTTNGTRALLSAAGAAARFPAALVNASAVARALADTKRDVTLLCAGTSGQVAMEDVLGCGAVIASLRQSVPGVELASDPARIADRLFATNRDRLRDVLADALGGRNVLSAGLPGDIDFASRLDAIDVVGQVDEASGFIRRLS